MLIQIKIFAPVIGAPYDGVERLVMEIKSEIIPPTDCKQWVADLFQSEVWKVLPWEPSSLTILFRNDPSQ